MPLSNGVKTVLSVWLPRPSSVPIGGVYVKFPATTDVAFNWLLLSTVPVVIDEGVPQVRTGVALFTITGTLVVVVV